MANNEYLIRDTTIQEIVDKVKLKTGTTGGIAGSEIANKIDSILTPTDGSIPTKTSSNLNVSGATVTVPAGYYASNASKSVSTATKATPSININSSGVVTSSYVQSAGYVTAGTVNASSVNVKNFDSNLTSNNIRSGVKIFGVSGDYSGDSLKLDTNLTYNYYTNNYNYLIVSLNYNRSRLVHLYSDIYFPNSSTRLYSIIYKNSSNEFDCIFYYYDNNGNSICNSVKNMGDSPENEYVMYVIGTVPLEVMGFDTTFEARTCYAFYI